jgi:HK97 gp10 family phage protein
MSTVRIQNRDKLIAKLKELPKSTRKHMRQAIVVSSEELVAMQKRMAPVDDGDLRDSIRYEMGGKQKLKAGVLEGDPDLTALIIAGGTKTTFHATFVEWGTKIKAANPYFYPAWRALKKRIDRRLRRAATVAAKEVAKNGS